MPVFFTKRRQCEMLSDIRLGLVSNPSKKGKGSQLRQHLCLLSYQTSTLLRDVYKMYINWSHSCLNKSSRFWMTSRLYVPCMWNAQCSIWLSADSVLAFVSSSTAQFPMMPLCSRNPLNDPKFHWVISNIERVYLHCLSRCQIKWFHPGDQTYNYS